MKTKQKILDFIIDYMTENQYSPSIQDIMNATGLTSTQTVHYHLLRLRYDGLIKYDGRRMISVKGYKFGKDSRYDTLQDI